jgi:hypothetical protein
MNDQDHDMRPDLTALLPTARRQHTFQVVPPAQQLAWLWQNSFSPHDPAWRGYPCPWPPVRDLPLPGGGLPECWHGVS